MPKQQIRLPAKLRLDDLYELFLDPPSKADNKALVIQYPLILNSLLFDETRCLIDEKNNIHAQLKGNSTIRDQLNNALQKIYQNELKEYQPPAKNEEFVFPAKFLQDRHNVATFMVELAESRDEANLYRDVFKNTQEARQETRMGNVFAGILMVGTAALAIAALVASAALPVLLPAIIAPVFLAASGLSAAYIARNRKTRAEGIDKNETKNLRYTLSEIVELKQEALQKKKLRAIQPNKLTPDEQKKYFRNIAKKQKKGARQSR